MNIGLKRQWRMVPGMIRKPVIFVAGMVFIIAAILTGWLPGPGGIPLFLIGIAILSTEFVWAKRVKGIVMSIIHRCGRWYRSHRQLGMTALTVLLVIGAISLYLMIQFVFFHHK